MVCLPQPLPTFSYCCRSPNEASGLVKLPLDRQQAFSHPGDALMASPVLGSNITAAAFRRRFHSCIVGINEASLLPGTRPHP